MLYPQFSQKGVNSTLVQLVFKNVLYTYQVPYNIILGHCKRNMI